MEKVVFQQAIARITAQAAYFTGKGALPPTVQAWFEGQPEDALQNKNDNFGFDCPALFYQFGTTKYSALNNIHMNSAGELTVHVVQNKVGKDTRNGGETHAAFIADLNYADYVIDLLHFYKMPCSARLIMKDVERDHTNRPLMIEKIHFTWNGRRRKDSAAP